jgi:hypothetical protein
LDGERRGVAPACGGKEKSSIESELHSLGEDVLFCNTLDARLNRLWNDPVATALCRRVD